MADETDLDNLDALIADGVKSVFSDGERIEFQSTADLIKARDAIAQRNSRPRFRPIRLVLSCND